MDNTFYRGRYAKDTALDLAMESWVLFRGIEYHTFVIHEKSIQIV